MGLCVTSTSSNLQYFLYIIFFLIMINWYKIVPSAFLSFFVYVLELVRTKSVS